MTAKVEFRKAPAAILLLAIACASPDPPPPRAEPMPVPGGINGRLLALAMYAYEGPDGRPAPGAGTAPFKECVNLTAQGVLFGRRYKAREHCFPGDRPAADGIGEAASPAGLRLPSYRGSEALHPQYRRNAPYRGSGM